MSQWNGIHIHGGPVWGKPSGSVSDSKYNHDNSLIHALYRNGCALVSFSRPDQLKKIVALKSAKLVLDNGAFSIWKKSKKTGEIVDWNNYWTRYYQWVMCYIGRIEWFIVPDVIEGSVSDNDKLIDSIPSSLRHKAVPVWHSDEPISRFVELCEKFERVAIGCCGDSGVIRSENWKKRMTEAFTAIYITRNMSVKIHGLRMLDGRALCQFPFDSADSANVAINVPKDRVRFPEVKCKLARTAILRASIEKVEPPSKSTWIKWQIRANDNIQLDLFS